MEQDAKDRLESAMKLAGYNMKSLSVKAQVGETFVRDILKRDRDPTLGKLKKVLGILDVTLSIIVSGEEMGKTVHLVGFVDLGGVVQFFSDTEKNHKYSSVPSPPEAPLQTVAIEVRADSMAGVADDGWLLYFRDIEETPSDNMLGKLCILWLEDGRKVIRRLYAGNSPGYWNLLSTTSGQLESNVVVKRSARVIWIRPD